MRRRLVHPGFTLLEVLLVVTIIALLMAIIVPALSRARQQARQTACGANLFSISKAVHMYLFDHQDKFWPYYTDQEEGRMWWFGFEQDGPGKGAYRPLDKSQGLLVPYLEMYDDHLQCPSFPYGNTDYFPKFETRSASYGYNVNLVGRPTSEYNRRSSSVFVFADGAHFDFGDTINEGFYIQYTPNAKFPSGYGHFRHQKRSQVLYLDSHVESQPLRGPAYWVAVAGQAGNLSDDSGGNAIYGF